MSEIKLFGGLLAVLLVGAYLSWTADRSVPTAKKVVLVDALPASIESIHLVGKTSTVTVTFRQDQSGERYPWFEVEAQGRTRRFTGSSRFEARLKSFAPFEAMRTLGRLSDSELADAGLSGRPERSLTLTLSGGRERAFDVGGRTSGARDHYVRARGADLVHLVESRVLGDLEAPDGQFMQRQLLAGDLRQVERVVLSDGEGRTRTLLHRNRQAAEEAFWAAEESPDTLNETLGNFIDKLSKVAVTEYVDDSAAFDSADVILETKWVGEDDKVLDALTLARSGSSREGRTFYAKSTATRVPVKVARFTAEQIENDLESVMSSRSSPDGGE